MNEEIIVNKCTDCRVIYIHVVEMRNNATLQFPKLCYITEYFAHKWNAPVFFSFYHTGIIAGVLGKAFIALQTDINILGI